MGISLQTLSGYKKIGILAYMKDSNLQCADCGTPLPSPEAVCRLCEPKYADLSSSSTAGKYSCPQCSARFDHVQLVWWPATAAWYRLQIQKLKCPHCNALLCDRKDVRFSLKEIFIFIGFMFLSEFSDKLPMLRILLLLTMVIVLLIRWRKARSSVIESERYGLANHSLL